MDCAFLIALCKSFEEGRCKERLSLYLERSVSKDGAIVEPIACPFYENGSCKIGGMIDFYTKTFYYKLPVYERKNGELEELKKPMPKPILRKDWNELFRT